MALLGLRGVALGPQASRLTTPAVQPGNLPLGLGAQGCSSIPGAYFLAFLRVLGPLSTVPPAQEGSALRIAVPASGRRCQDRVMSVTASGQPNDAPDEEPKDRE